MQDFSLLQVGKIHINLVGEEGIAVKVFAIKLQFNQVRERLTSK